MLWWSEGCIERYKAPSDANLGVALWVVVWLADCCWCNHYFYFCLLLYFHHVPGRINNDNIKGRGVSTWNVEILISKDK